MRLDDAHRLRGVRHPLGHHQRDCKRSVPSGDRRNRGYPFRYRLFRLHPLVIHPLTSYRHGKEKQQDGSAAMQVLREFGI